MSPAGQGREERDPGNSGSSRAFDSGCANLLQVLANATTSVLINAQMLEWKQRGYSLWKGHLREIERDAQRGSELMKRTLRRLAPAANQDAETRELPDCNLESVDAVTAQGPGGAEGLRRPKNSRPAPDFFPPSDHVLKVELTSRCDGCPSVFPKKG